jgi:hypothetical protein
MRRVALLATLLLTAASLLAGTASAQSLPEYRWTDHANRAAATESFTCGAIPGLYPPGFPLAPRWTGSGVIQGHVWGYAGATVAWSTSIPGGTASGQTTTDAGGAYTCSGLPATAGQGTIWVRTTTGLVIGRVSLTWGDPGSTTFDFATGEAHCVVTRGGPMPGCKSVAVNLSGSDATSMTRSWSSSSDVDHPDPLMVEAIGMEGHSNMAAVYWWSNEGIEANIDLTVNGVAGQIGPYDETAAYRTQIAAPLWASGAPGTSVKLRLQGYPNGWVNRLQGRDAYPFNSPTDSFGTFTSTGAVSDYTWITIPATATPGYAYNVTAQHDTGPLGLTATFQVCTIKPTALSIAAGQSLRLKGVVPISGHEGTTAGKPTTVIVFARTGAAGQPTKWDPTGQGWRRVTSDATNGFGAFATVALHPRRTTWYVVRYPGDSRYFRGYTAVVKVRVR